MLTVWVAVDCDFDATAAKSTRSGPKRFLDLDQVPGYVLGFCLILAPRTWGFASHDARRPSILDACRLFQSADDRQPSLLAGDGSRANNTPLERSSFGRDRTARESSSWGRGWCRSTRLGRAGSSTCCIWWAPATRSPKPRRSAGTPARPGRRRWRIPPACCCPTNLLPRALQQNHALCLELLGSFAQWVRHFVSLVEDIALRDAVGRVARYLAQHADPATSGQVRLSPLKKHVASHLNLTAETLSRTLRRLTDEGVIESIDGKTIVVKDLPRLGAAADGEFPHT